MERLTTREQQQLDALGWVIVWRYRNCRWSFVVVERGDK